MRCVNCAGPAHTLRRMQIRPAALLAVLMGACAGVYAEPPPLLSLPALTPIYLRIDAELSSRKSRKGDRFPLSVHEDVMVDGVVVIPAGSAGEGEVVHAARSGMGGKPGELVLAARHVRVGGREIRLRSMFIGGTGDDRVDPSVAATILFGIPGTFIVGGVIRIPSGTIASAKISNQERLPAAPGVLHVNETRSLAN